MSELIEAVLTIDDPAGMCCTAALQIRNMAVMLVWNVRSHSSSGVFPAGPASSGRRHC